MIHSSKAQVPSHSREAGMVSMVVTVILMLVISITVLGFAQIIRREQRQALDNQLSSQAFYAAESGVNDARQIIGKYFAGTVPTSKTDCGPQPGVYSQLTGVIDDSTGTSYSCLLIEGSPKSLEYDLSTSEPSKVFPLFSDGATITSLDFEWTSPAVTDPLAGGVCPATVNDQLPPTANWKCGYGILRLDLASIDGGMQQSTLMGKTFTSFFMPTAPNSPAAYTVPFTASGNVYGTTVNQGSISAANCDGTRCKITVNGLNGLKYYARAMMIYRGAKLTVTAWHNNTKVGLTGAQVLIDSTGKANDVLRRVQVRVPLVHDGLHGDYGIDSNYSLCKNFETSWGHSNSSSC